MAGIELLPAVDVLGGQAVRLVQGAAGTQTRYGDPLDAAVAWQDEGARWIHLVDLDAALRTGSNAARLARIVEKLNVNVELSGGICDATSLRSALDTGCARVVIGTAALRNPAWVREVTDEYGQRVALGLDVRGSRLAARGWTTDGGDLAQAVTGLGADGCARYVVTDVARDGMMNGPNLGLLRAVCEMTGRPVIASGGVASLADVRAVAAGSSFGIEGLIVGKALYQRRFTLAQALAAVAG